MLTIQSITFPVYPLRPFEKILKGSQGAVFIQDKLGDIYILDDTSKIGNFGRRRLALRLQLADSDTIKLYKLKKSCHNLSELLSNVRKVKSKTYVDNTGKVFSYTPSVFVPLKYYKILKVQILEGKRSFLVLDGLPQKIPVPRPPPDDMNWAGILLSHTGNILYEYSDKKLKDSIRKI